VPEGVPKEANFTPVIVPDAHASVNCGDVLPTAIHSFSSPPTQEPPPPAGCGGVAPAGLATQDLGTCVRLGPGASWYWSHGLAAEALASATAQPMENFSVMRFERWVRNTLAPDRRQAPACWHLTQPPVLAGLELRALVHCFRVPRRARRRF
jgi:hypothetical protein